MNKSEEIRRLLADPTTAKLHDSEIAKRVGCNRALVNRIRMAKAEEQGDAPIKRCVLLKLSDIVRDEKLQMRERLNLSTVKDYAELMKEGVKFDPAKVVDNGRILGTPRYWLVDGWHRAAAAESIGQQTLLCDIYCGDFKQALKMAYHANSENRALPRTNADKRKAVRSALSNPDLANESNYKIAELCGVVESFVRKVKHELEDAHSAHPKIRPKLAKPLVSEPLQAPTLSISDTSPRNLEEALTVIASLISKINKLEAELAEAKKNMDTPQ